ncbi:HAD-like domain-containing protein [Syncephalis fuscata]|nr:HAD-like domain-containing protein [Syncephalis fuscata]
MSSPALTTSALVPKCLLVDIEGTTTSISFVHDKLFPLVRAELASFLDAAWTRADVQDSVALIRQQAVEDHSNGLSECPVIPESGEAADIKEAVKANVLWQMDSDRKTGGLKRLQGQIWRNAYESGTVKGELFEDVLPALHRCQALNVPVYVYSSGSVEAQKLLFTHSEYGNLQPVFSGNFDTTIGSKIESASYIAIAQQIQLPTKDILFLSDNPKEIKAASDTGMQTAILDRPGNAPLDEMTRNSYLVLNSFESLFVV